MMTAPYSLLRLGSHAEVSLAVCRKIDRSRPSAAVEAVVTSAEASHGKAVDCWHSYLASYAPADRRAVHLGIVHIEKGLDIVVG
jgi:hypothetical protein